MPKKVLVIDDEIDTCKMLATGLKLLGFETDYALSALQAFKKFGESAPNAVVLDLMMPDADGYEVMRRMKANPATAALPIVIVSATAQPGAEERCKRAGANFFMHKPVSLQELSDIIAKLL
ncbi:MAG: response regulator [Chloroflexi bacterium]|nr:response regulator [Chloroflexota bacterium]